jgi:HSP20 family protein
MSNITRTDPFREFALRSEFEGFPSLGRLRRMFGDLPAEPTIKVEVTEDERAYKVKADLPGVKKEDIAVEVDGNQVSISAEVKREKEEKEAGEVVHSERYYGKQFRSFSLGRDIDRKKVEAKYADGVLELTLPKNDATATGKIAIK